MTGTPEKKMIRTMRLSKYLDWASGMEKDPSLGILALPMIQRASVWKPNQIIDLWDTVLRGMPLGCFLEYDLKKGAKYVDIKTRNLKELAEGEKGVGLIDGQQRTLTMLLGWPQDDEMADRRIWIDLADNPGEGYLFRLHVTTKNQPFGFQKSSPSTKLSLSDRKKAFNAYELESMLNKIHPYPNQSPEELKRLIKNWQENRTYEDSQTNQEIVKLLEKNRKNGLKPDELFKQSKPYHSKAAINLRNLIKIWNTDNSEQSLKCEIQKQLRVVEYTEAVASNVELFIAALKRLSKLEIPIIKISSEVLNDNVDDDKDPPLAILFKRIGTGGTNLSDEDYVYSIIKHRLPSAYGLVETLHNNHTVASLLTATDLVMTAVRLVAAELGNKNNLESPTKKQFHLLLKKEEPDDEEENSTNENGQSPTENKKDLGAFLSAFQSLIDSGRLEKSFELLTGLIRFNPEDEHDIGIPLHAFPILKRPLVQILLRWIRCIQVNHPEQLDKILEDSRSSVLQFILFWQLCVVDQRKASHISYNFLTSDTKQFPAKEIYHELINGEKPLALQLISPDELKSFRPNMIVSPEGSKLRGWRRFEIKADENLTESQKKAIELYGRWWGNGHTYVHPLLLWLQRELVSTWDESSPLAGRDEDTPYDYDHICPQSHWSGRGAGIFNFREENDDTGHWRTGNSIGNVRVWNSTFNRSDGDVSPERKLFIDDEGYPSKKRLIDSAIEEGQADFWKKCSPDGDDKNVWNLERVIAFQKAIETRTFDLYSMYFNQLGFDEWLKDSKALVNPVVTPF